MFRTNFNQVKPAHWEMMALRERAMQHPRAKASVFWWILGEGSGLRAFDVTLRHPLNILTAGNTWVTDQHGPALQLDGTNNDGSADGKPTAIIENGYTLSAFARKTTNGNDSQGCILAISRSSGADDLVYNMTWLGGTNRRLRLTRWNNGGGFIENVDSTTQMTVGERYHTGATFSSLVGTRTFINGRIDGAGSSNTTLNANPGVQSGNEPYRLGATNIGTSGMFWGVLDNARLWARTLNPEEMYSLFQWPYMEFVEAAEQLNRTILLPGVIMLDPITHPTPITAPGIVTTGLRVLEQFPAIQPTRMRVFETELGANHVFVVRATRDSARLYSPVAIGGELKGSPISSIPLIGCSALFLLDTNMLRDEHDEAGFYLAVIPETGNEEEWTGAIIFRSTDGGNTWQQIAATALSVRAVGITVTALGNASHPFAWDFTNALTVNLSHGTVESTDFENAYEGVNTALIGNELATFRTVTPGVGSSQVILSDWIRGRRGTDVFVSGHTAGELFIVLDTGDAVVRRVDPASVLGTERLYQAQSFNQTLEGCSVIPFTNNGAGLKPHAPAHLKATRDGSNNITFTWNRRSRVVGTWTLTRDAPLAETVEAYELDIYDPTFTTFKRTIVASSQTAPYFIGDQTSDFGGAQIPVGVDLVQLSSIVGRGYVTRALV